MLLAVGRGVHAAAPSHSPPVAHLVRMLLSARLAQYPIPQPSAGYLPQLWGVAHLQQAAARQGCRAGRAGRPRWACRRANVQPKQAMNHVHRSFPCSQGGNDPLEPPGGGNGHPSQQHGVRMLSRRSHIAGLTRRQAQQRAHGGGAVQQQQREVVDLWVGVGCWGWGCGASVDGNGAPESQVVRHGQTLPHVQASSRAARPLDSAQHRGGLRGLRARRHQKETATITHNVSVSPIRGRVQNSPLRSAGLQSGQGRHGPSPPLSNPHVH